MITFKWILNENLKVVAVNINIFNKWLGFQSNNFYGYLHVVGQFPVSVSVQKIETYLRGMFSFLAPKNYWTVRHSMRY